jgi:hypothetical protein
MDEQNYEPIGGDNFPPEYVSPDEKAKPEYGVAYAKAMYATTNRMGAGYFYDDSDYQALIEVAQGRQSVENIRKLFGFFDPVNSDLADDGSANLAYIDIQVLNLAPKYINRAVAKMQKYSYDIAVDAVDPVSVREKDDYATNIQAFYRLKDWITSMGADPKEMFPDLDVESLPKYPDELLYDIATNPKIKKEIAAELSIKLLHSINGYKQKMREYAGWIVAIGKGHMHFYLDENGIPRIEAINPKYFLGSYVDNESYQDQENSGFFDFLTVNQLRKEMLASGYSEEEIKTVADRWRTGTIGATSPEMTSNWYMYDGLDRIPVLRFYFISQDNRRYVKMKNKYGSDILLEKMFNYAPAPEIQEHFDKGDRRIIDNTYTTVYGGTWILDTDVVFGYGPKKYPRQKLVEAVLPIISFAPNMKQGRVVSFLSQMIEPLNMINVAWNKIKEIIAKGWMGIRNVNFDKLESVAMGAGGTQWTPRQVYEHLLRTNTLISRNVRNRYDQTDGSPGVFDDASGLQLSDHFTTLTTAINILEQMTSTNVADSISAPDRLSATSVKQSAVTSDTDLEYLYNAHETMYLEGSKMLLLLLQETLRDGNVVSDFVPALGNVNTRVYTAPPYLALCEYGLTLSRQPTAEEWAAFFADVSIALANKEISVADSAFIREINNLKQARQILVIRHNQHKRTLREEAQFANDLAIQSNTAAAEAKAKFEADKERNKIQGQMELEALKGRINLLLIQAEKDREKELIGVENMSDERIKRQEGLDSIIKESMRARAERYSSDSKLQGTVLGAMQKAESDRKKISQATKPKKS